LLVDDDLIDFRKKEKLGVKENLSDPEGRAGDEKEEASQAVDILALESIPVHPASIHRDMKEIKEEVDFVGPDFEFMDGDFDVDKFREYNNVSDLILGTEETSKATGSTYRCYGKKYREFLTYRSDLTVPQREALVGWDLGVSVSFPLLLAVDHLLSAFLVARFQIFSREKKHRNLLE